MDREGLSSGGHPTTTPGARRTMTLLWSRDATTKNWLASSIHASRIAEMKSSFVHSGCLDLWFTGADPRGVPDAPLWTASSGSRGR